MIIGSCPYNKCKGRIWLGCDDWHMPSLYKHECESCKQTIYTKITRVDPQSWTLENFLKLYQIDEETKTVKEI